MKKINFTFITLFPELVKNYLSDAILSKAVEQSLLQIETVNLRDFSDNKYKSVDDSPFGGGDGMLIRPDILEAALLSVKKENSLVIYLSPQGKLLNQELVKQLSASYDRHIILICGRYAGIDERFIEEYVDMEISIGDYVLSGGELPALVLVEAVSRFVPGVLGKTESAINDSFKNNLLEAPQYTRPQEWKGRKVPEVLVSGNHRLIDEWKEKTAIEVTKKKRPELIK